MRDNALLRAGTQGVIWLRGRVPLKADQAARERYGISRDTHSRASRARAYADSAVSSARWHERTDGLRWGLAICHTNSCR
jgi:hypothetical protein